MTEQETLKKAYLEKIALFYYFALLDEEKALQASYKTIKSVFGKIAKNQNKEEIEKEIVSHAQECLNSYEAKSNPSGMSLSSGHIIFPQGSNWGPWFELKKTCEVNDFIALVWVHLIKVSVPTVAQALKVSEGTVRLRAGRALRLLGRMQAIGGEHA